MPAPTLTASHLHRTLRANLDGHRASGDAFVASVYGEWGIGKTRCLKDVETLFQQELDNALSGDFDTGKEIRLTVPVFFVPWQYEHEEHLVVPLLKTIEHRLLALDKDLKKPLPEELKTRLVSAAGKFGDFSVALLSGFKFKFAPLKDIFGLEVDLDPSKIFETAKKNAQAHPDRFASYESLYFNAYQTLVDIAKVGEVELRFVLLIDDLDRCLPEKAIQMLESVKLFLNAPGFAFVLAVDDEVVERGIQHRYRDYVTKDGEHTHAIPVTGAQYLEKIVQLPVHLPRWSYSEAEAFLRESFPDYFGGGEANRPGAGRYQDLLKLLLRACPLVPRKLIRAVEGLVFIEERMKSHFYSLPLTAEWSARHALRLVLIQQLYPPFYRQMRDDPDSYWRLFRTRRDAHGHLVYGEEKHTLAKLKTQLNEAGDAADGAGDELTRTLQRYLQALESAHGQHSGDPLLLVRPAKRNEPADNEERNPLSFAEFDAFYLHHLPLKDRPLSFANTGETLPEADIPDIDAFLEVLFLADGVQRGRALEELNLAGRRLPTPVFRAICRTAAQPDKHARLIDPDWLGDLDALLTPQQLADFYEATKLLSLLAEETHA